MTREDVKEDALNWTDEDTLQYCKKDPNFSAKYQLILKQMNERLCDRQDYIDAADKDILEWTTNTMYYIATQKNYNRDDLDYKVLIAILHDYQDLYG